MVGGVWYLIQAWSYAHSQPSVLDEGAYLVKGYLFASGRYQPFQEYGPWTNHMPLSFLIPGYIQLWFGPGLRTGRYYAFALSALILLGIWILARRLGGRWWAAATVGAFALNPAIIKLYSVAVSQVLIAFMLTWVLVFALGDNRPVWQVLLGVALAGMMVVTRLNLTPVLLFLLPYVFWQHGMKVGLMATLTALVIVVVEHALFWPGIMTRWLLWVPVSIAQKITPGLPEAGVEFAGDIGRALWFPTASLSSRFSSFLHGIRTQFTLIMGALTTWLLWQRRASILISKVLVISDRKLGSSVPQSSTSLTL